MGLFVSESFRAQILSVTPPVGHEVCLFLRSRAKNLREALPFMGGYLFQRLTKMQLHARARELPLHGVVCLFLRLQK